MSAKINRPVTIKDFWCPFLFYFILLYVFFSLKLRIKKGNSLRLDGGQGLGGRLKLRHRQLIQLVNTVNFRKNGYIISLVRAFPLSIFYPDLLGIFLLLFFTRDWFEIWMVLIIAILLVI